MPLKTGGKGKMQEYDPATGKFGRGSVGNATPKDEDAVVTVVWKGQKITIKGPLEKYHPPVEEAKDNSTDFKTAVSKNREK